MLYCRGCQNPIQIPYYWDDYRPVAAFAGLCLFRTAVFLGIDYKLAVNYILMTLINSFC